MMCSCFLRGFVSEGGGERERESCMTWRGVCVMCDGVCV
jgi:hypothetical protein